MRATPFLILFFVLLTSTASARTWSVNPEGTGDAPTIAAAIDSASSGDNIELAGGSYYEAELIVDGKDLMISKGSGIPVLISPSYGSGTGITFRNTTGASSITGITFRGYESALIIDNSSPLVWFNTVKDCGTGFHVTGSSSADLGYSLIDSCGTAVYVEQSVGTMVRNNTIVNSSTGITVVSGSVSVNRNIISGCETGVECSGGAISSDCNDFWNNQTDYTGCSGGAGDIFEDPIFCYLTSPSPDLYYLHKDSPCWASNNPCGVNIGAFIYTAGCEGEAVEETSWGAIKSMYR